MYIYRFSYCAAETKANSCTITVSVDQTSITSTAEKRAQNEARYNKRQKLDETVQESLESDLHQPFKCNEVIVETEQPKATPEPLVPYFPTVHDMTTQTAPQPMFSIENFSKDDKAIQFYTGLESYLKFKFVLNTLGPAAYSLNYIYHSVEKKFSSKPVIHGPNEAEEIYKF